MPLIDDVTVRRATARDYDEIVRNGDVFYGKDYLAAIFLDVVNDPDVYPVVAELRGQVVGFMMDHVLDGGMSVIRRAVRTYPGYRNMGVMYKMSRLLNSSTEEHFANLRYRYTCIQILEDKTAEDSLRMKGFTEILRKLDINLVYRISEITDPDTKDELPPILLLEYDDVKTLFTLDDVLEKMFPMKLLFNFSIGYRCLESNIKHVLGENKQVYITTRTTSPTQDTTKLNLLQDMDMVTFSYWFMAEKGLVYAIDIYAKEGHNEASLEAHIQRHLRVLKDLNLCDRGVLFVSLGGCVCEGAVRSLLGRCGIVDRLPNADTWKALFEKKIEPQEINC